MRSRIAYFLLVLISILLNFPQVGNAPPVLFVRSSVHTAGYFFEWSSASMLHGSNNLFGFIVNARKFEKENAALNDKLRYDEAQLLVLEKIENENQQLRGALNFRETRPYGFHLTAAEVVSRGGGDISVVINKGELDGIKEGMTVINRSGLVGRIGEVSEYSSKVNLLTDSINVVSSVLLRTGTYGVVRGGDRLTMDYVPSDVSVEAGEKIVVSTASSAFMHGIPVGNVRAANKKVEDLFQKVEVDPAVDFSKLDVVYVCQP